jgi:ankyrin repeat protein
VVQSGDRTSYCGIAFGTGHYRQNPAELDILLRCAIQLGLDIHKVMGETPVTQLSFLVSTKVLTVDAFQTLLHHGADVMDNKNLSGRIALQQAVSKRLCSEVMLRILLSVRTKEQLDFQDNLGDTALHVAAKEQNLRCMRELIRAGGDLNVKNEEGATPCTVLESLPPNMNIGKLIQEIREGVSDGQQDPEPAWISKENRRAGLDVK